MGSKVRLETSNGDVLIGEIVTREYKLRFLEGLPFFKNDESYLLLKRSNGSVSVLEYSYILSIRSYQEGDQEVRNDDLFNDYLKSLN